MNFRGAVKCLLNFYSKIEDYEHYCNNHLKMSRFIPVDFPRLKYQPLFGKRPTLTSRRKTGPDRALENELGIFTCKIII